VLAQAASEGCRFLIGPECEFFLFHLDDNGIPTTLTHEQAGYFDVSPMDLGENARRDIDLTMEEMGYRVDGSHHEYAAAQHEIDLHYSEALEAADTIETFRLAARTIARRHGLHATFMPKPCSGVHGSGMHINISMLKNGINVFSDENNPNGLSREALYFIGGLMEHIPGMTAILNPVVNSYKRLVTCYEAPRYNAWSATNRSMLVRVPALRGFNTRIELRSPDSTANPYLTLALCLAAGLDGIENRIEPSKEAGGNLYDLSKEERRAEGIERLPGNLWEAIKVFEKSEFARRVLGEHIADRYTEAKKQEWETYCRQITAWELEEYLGKY
jgi:glutamine synthetase